MSGAAARELPDPLVFASDALAARGALVEPSDGGCLAVLPPELAQELGVPETFSMTSGAKEAFGDAAGAEPPVDRVPCAIGAPLLDRLAESARGRAPYAALASAADPPRPSQARALAERFAARNAVTDVTGVLVADACYLVAWFAWRAEADDRYDGAFVLALHAGDGSEPDAAIAELADPARPGSALTLGLLDPPAPSPEATAILGSRAAAVARGAIGPASAAVARRHERDHRRVDEYFAALAADARAPKRRIEASALDAKLRHLEVERDAKLKDLAQRYTLRVTVDPVALVALTIPVAHARVHVRRRKREGEIVLRLPATAGSLDRLACAGCAGSTSRPVVCDDALHVLCEACAPSAQGRPRCPAC